jgi:hypothetical protein
MPLDTGRLRAELQKVYSEVVRDPKTGYHFHRAPSTPSSASVRPGQSSPSYPIP